MSKFVKLEKLKIGIIKDAAAKREYHPNQIDCVFFNGH
jgi:hypothetical protein